MSERPLRQPPNPDDLRRFPPAGPECARIRGLTRDFVDRELEAAAAAAVEEHVHTCRECGLALARAEHELLLVQKALPRIVETARVGFADGVMQRLLDDGESSESASDAVPAQTVPHRIGLAARFLVSMPGSLMLSVMVLAGLVLVQSFAGAGEERAPERMGRLVITSSIDTHGLLGGERVRLGSGDGLGDDQTVIVGAGGAAQADYHDKSEGTQPAATLQLGGNAAVRLRDGHPVLVNGKLQVDARRPFGFQMADGSKLELGMGEYVLTAENSSGPQWDPSLGVPDDLLITVAVLHGDGAHILRDDRPPIYVGPGDVGVYSGGEVIVESNPEFGPPSRGDVSVPPALGSAGGSLRGVIWERSGSAAVGSTVRVSYRSGGQMHSASATVSPLGVFQFETGIAGAPPLCESPFAVVQVLPPVHRAELGITTPEAFRLSGGGLHVHLHESLVIDSSPVFAGSVIDSHGQRVLGLRLIPCIVDELFGCVLTWPEGQVTTDGQGRFRMMRLPARLPNHQSLVVVLEHPHHASTIIEVPVRGAPVAAEFSGRVVAQPLRPVRLLGLDANTIVEVWQDIEGLPPGSAARLYTAQTNEFGVVESLMVGGGRLFVRSSNPSQSVLRELALVSQQGVPSYHLAPGAPLAFGEVYEMQHVLPGTSMALAGSSRHERFAATSAVAADLDVTLHDALTGTTIPAAQVFAVQAGGPRGRARVRFVGFTSMVGSVEYIAHSSDIGIVAIASSGAMATAQLTQLISNHGWLEMAGTGRVLLDESLRPALGSSQAVLTIRFELLGSLPGLDPTLRRFASEGTNWLVGGLPPGSYRASVGDQVLMVDVVAGGTVVLH